MLYCSRYESFLLIPSSGVDDLVPALLSLGAEESCCPW
uniref:Uncharacterized protein n=1 Tax=Arundo donax TaxID=35708 RepID=A0A0A9B9U8_ARUDO